jgi:DNA-binding SARP family transcriptional activator
MSKYISADKTCAEEFLNKKNLSQVLNIFENLTTCHYTKENELFQ